jgi:uroporphyrinogen decarboxylase
MRQAGRSLPEYRRIRADVAMLDACRRPDLITAITLQPVRRHGVDAAILFSDIVVPLVAAGLEIELVSGIGPVVANPIRSAADLDDLPQLVPNDLWFITEAVGMLANELGRTPLIGFAGAPYTLASYLVEGGPSKAQERTKALMLSDPGTWQRLCSWLADVTTTFLQVQVAAGASAVQLFDSWVGGLSADDYATYVLPHSRAVLAALGPTGVPRIHFGVQTAHLLPLMAAAGAEVVGVDWRTPLDQAAALVGPGHALQGNLDPAVLLAPWDVIETRARDVIARGKAAAGHVFNLGHGVLPATDPDVLTRLVELVQQDQS